MDLSQHPLVAAAIAGGIVAAMLTLLERFARTEVKIWSRPGRLDFEAFASEEDPFHHQEPRDAYRD